MVPVDVEYIVEVVYGILGEVAPAPAPPPFELGDVAAPPVHTLAGIHVSTLAIESKRYRILPGTACRLTGTQDPP